LSSSSSSSSSSSYSRYVVEVSAFCAPSTTAVSRVPHKFTSAICSKIQQRSTTIESDLPTSKKSNATTSKSSTTTVVSMSLAIALAVATATATTVTATTKAAYAYIPSDYASETVQKTIQDLKSASGKNAETFTVYESIATIITEGKGVGGMINFKGVELERGYVADEDTSIYNPGLSLLTESEKERLVEAVIDARKDGLAKGQWSENNEYAYGFLKGKLDPLHMVELSTFLKFVPFYGGFLYLAVLGVQQLFRDSFQKAYLVGVVAFILPILVLIATGP